MWLMYSSMTILISSTMLMLRAVWNTRSSSQPGLAASSIAQSRLCSRRNRVLIAAVNGVELARSPPKANSAARLGAGQPCGRCVGSGTAAKAGSRTPAAS